MGNLYVDYAVIIAIPSIISCIVCSTYVNDYIKRTGKQSVLVLMLNIVMILSALFLVMSMKNRISYNLDKDIPMWKFNSFCAED
mmetsp:Transcript_8191/g.8459  ORF Transcript_8191/g.8459 Transcript_8191/m.8459 type:complete len:84 (+) Transcript_8191:1-252(+)